MHVASTWAGPEIGVSWFFHTVGSGVFLDLTRLPAEGRIEAYRSRCHFTASRGIAWVGDTAEGLLNYMIRRNVSAIVITEAWGWEARWDAGCTALPQANPRTEIIARQRQSVLHAAIGREGSSRPDLVAWEGMADDQGGVHLPHRSCLTDPPMGFAFRSGVDATKPCDCVPASHLNCGLARGET